MAGGQCWTCAIAQHQHSTQGSSNAGGHHIQWSMMWFGIYYIVRISAAVLLYTWFAVNTPAVVSMFCAIFLLAFIALHSSVGEWVGNWAGKWLLKAQCNIRLLPCNVAMLQCLILRMQLCITAHAESLLSGEHPHWNLARSRGGKSHTSVPGSTWHRIYTEKQRWWKQPQEIIPPD